MAKKKITLDDLAVMVQKGFAEMNDRFKGVDQRFEQVDKRFEQIDKRLDRIENLLLRDHLNRIERLEDKVRVLETTLETGR